MYTDILNVKCLFAW